MSNLIVGDIGGTNARFAVLAVPGAEVGASSSPVDDGDGLSSGRLELLDEEWYPSRRFPTLEDALGAFVEDAPSARAASYACFGIAGPVRDDRCEATNLPWVVDGRSIADAAGLARVHLLNDVEAAAWGLGRLGPNGVRTIKPGIDAPRGNRALIAPGTGLGEAALVWDGAHHHPFATEGGHADFGPADELQVELWRFLARRHGHVSWERVLSGPGIVALFEFFLDHEGGAEPSWLERERREGDPAAAITGRARDDRCPRCRRTVDLFFSILGAEAGNLVLHTLATGGLYVAGGIVPKLLTEILQPHFLDAFLDKGRFRTLLEEVPVRVVVDDRLALWGAAARLARLMPAVEGAPS